MASPFQLHAPYEPKGDQPEAIHGLVAGVEDGERYQTLLGATGTGKTFTIANVIARTGRPTLVLAHNKTLAAQLCNELREFFPHNAVEYFISYYDYYQPEAYVPVSDTYIAKTASINEEIDMLRHSATRSLFERRDVIVVASISCIYGLGIPSEYLKAAVTFQVGDTLNLRGSLRELVNNQYSRNDVEISRGRFRVRGDVLEIGPAYEDRLVRIELFGDEVEAIRYVDPTTGEILQSLDTINIYPAKHFVTPKERLAEAIKAIRVELRERLDLLNGQGRLLEAQRLEQRTTYDLEMLEQVGYCNGVENYARHLAGREAGTPPECLIDYFPDDWLLVVDESHVTCSQLQAMYNGDQSRKQVLIEHGFRLPSAADNRPLKGEEFWEKARQTIFVSATPGNWELEQSGGQVVEQVIRPTGVLDPVVEVRPTEGQVDDLLGEIRTRAEKQERVLVTTLTKRMAEDLTDYLAENGVRVRYLHSEIHSIERIEIIQDLRNGDLDRADRDHPGPQERRLRRAGGREPAARGPGSTGSVAGGDPRCRQGGFPARRALADPDHRPGGAPRGGGGPALRRQPHRLDGQGDLGNRAPPRHPAHLQPEARHHAHAGGQAGRQCDPGVSGGVAPAQRRAAGAGHRAGRAQRGAAGLAAGADPAARGPDEGRGEEPRVRGGRQPARPHQEPAPEAGGQGLSRGA